MAEGEARLNQQVVEPEYWQRSGPVGRRPGPPLPAPPDSLEQDRRRTDVSSAVEADIVPRVFLNQRSLGQPARVAAEGAGIGEDDIQRFVRMLLSYDDDAVVRAFLEGIEARGVSIAEIYLGLFQPAARHIGDLWADDRCTFVDVTLAVGTLQKMLRTFGPAFHRGGRPPESHRQALLLPLPGDQHTFGLSMLSEFFRRAGWCVWNTPLASQDEIGEAVKTAWFSLVGFSVSTDNRLDELTAAIRLIRRCSCNPDVGIMVGGPIFIEHPDYVARVGADATGPTAVQALARAESFAAPAITP